MYKLEENYQDALDKIEELQERIEELQERIDKAIEYFVRRDIEWGSYEQKFLLNILRGEDNE